MARTEQIKKFKKAVKACKGKTRTAFRSCMRVKLTNDFRRKHKSK